MPSAGQSDSNVGQIVHCHRLLYIIPIMKFHIVSIEVGGLLLVTFLYKYQTLLQYSHLQVNLFCIPPIIFLVKYW
jgi:hypothetical protein